MSSSKEASVVEELSAGVLRDMLQRCEEERSALAAQVKQLELELQEQQADKADIYFFLNKKLDDNYEIMSSLEQQLVQEQAARERLDTALKQQAQESRTKVSTLETRHKARVAELEEKLQHLQEFSERKEELEHNLQAALATIEQERQSFEQLSKSLERKVIQERDRLRKEHEKELAKAKLELEAKLGQSLAIKTKQTQETNNAMKLELQFQARQADYVLRVNQKMTNKAKHLEKELEIAQMQEKAMMKKLAKYRRLVRELNMRLRSNTPGNISPITTAYSKTRSLSHESLASAEDIEEEYAQAISSIQASKTEEKLEAAAGDGVQEQPQQHEEVSLYQHHHQHQQHPPDKYDAVATFLAEMYEEICAQPSSDYIRPSTYETLIDRRDEILERLVEAYLSRKAKLNADRTLPTLATNRQRKAAQDWREMRDRKSFYHGESTSTFDPKEWLSISSETGTRFGNHSAFTTGPAGTRPGRLHLQDDPLVKGRSRGRNSQRDSVHSHRTTSQDSQQSSDTEIPAPASGGYEFEKMVAIGRNGHHRPYQKRQTQPKSPSFNLLTVSLSSDR